VVSKTPSVVAISQLHVQRSRIWPHARSCPPQGRQVRQGGANCFWAAGPSAGILLSWPLGACSSGAHRAWQGKHRSLLLLLCSTTMQLEAPSGAYAGFLLLLCFFALGMHFSIMPTVTCSDPGSTGTWHKQAQAMCQ
jgi:hypothetical protein